ncbi:MAG: prolyl-tRNA synthetase associated domain-containing protein [Chloroflexi bacterium]|nr:prolyl-tRNA synthetase associated domain-containing protein [Chloroflexota bacterium]
MEEKMIAFLREHAIPYQRVEHPPVYTSAESGFYLQNAPGEEGKNLFLTDKKGRRTFLVLSLERKRVDLKALGDLLGAPKLKFASEERLMEHLGVTPGAVDALAVINDVESKVELVIDADLWRNDSIRSHPLVNTATFILARADLERFFALTGHTPLIMSLPELSAGEPSAPEPDA